MKQFSRSYSLLGPFCMWKIDEKKGQMSSFPLAKGRDATIVFSCHPTIMAVASPCPSHLVPIRLPATYYLYMSDGKDDLVVAGLFASTPWAYNKYYCRLFFGAHLSTIIRDPTYFDLDINSLFLLYIYGIYIMYKGRLNLFKRPKRVEK